MAIELNIDFHDLFYREGEFPYANLYHINNEEFNNWVKENFNHYTQINNFEDIVPDAELVDDFREIGYVHRGSQCHYSAKVVSLLDENYCYISGFVMSKRVDFGGFLTHSFNMYNNQVIDFSKRNDDLTIYEYHDIGFPHNYYGIKIPTEFIAQYREDAMNGCMNPLLIEWYNEINI